MCHNRDMFTNVISLSRPVIVNLPNVKSASVTQFETIMLSGNVALHRVLYIPNFRYNLLSVSKICSHEGCYVIFTPKCCIMQAPLVKRPQVLGELFRGLYLLQSNHIFAKEVADSSYCFKDFLLLVINQLAMIRVI